MRPILRACSASFQAAPTPDIAWLTFHGAEDALRQAIFIGYRRADTADVAGRLYDALSMAFGDGEVFKDVDSIPIGADFSAHIKKLLPKCRIFLALIGPGWANAGDASGTSRLDNEKDLVRIEIETALATPKLLFVPVLVNGAHMPAENEVPESIRALLAHNAAILRRDPDFKSDVARLIAALREHLRTGRLNLQPLGGAARVVANAADVSGWVVLSWLLVAGFGVMAAVPQVRQPVVSAAISLLRQSPDHVPTPAPSAQTTLITTPVVSSPASQQLPPTPPPRRQSLGDGLSVTLISLAEDQDRYIATLRFQNTTSSDVGVAVLWDGYAQGRMVLTDSVGGSCQMIANGEGWGTMSAEQLDHYFGAGDFRPIPSGGQTQQTIFFNKGRCGSPITLDNGLTISGSFILSENNVRRATTVFFSGLTLIRRE